MPRSGSSHDVLRLSSGSAVPPRIDSPDAPALPQPGPTPVEAPWNPASESRSALILVGHGSHLNADSSAPVYAHAAALRASGVFAEVHEAFWKEEPPLTAVLDLPDVNDVLIIPLFLSEGYFTREVLPREMGLTGALTRRGGRTFRYLPPVGTHPAMTEMILQRARSVLGSDPLRQQRATLVVIGHGTERNATSGDTVYSLVERLRLEGNFGAVTCGFLDEAPQIGEVIAAIRSPEVVLVPFFVAEGWHTRETIPAELGLEGEVTRKGGQTVWYTPPVGTLAEMSDVILEMAAESAAGDGPHDPGAIGTDAGPANEKVDDSGRPAGARAAFSTRIRDASDPVRLMDVVVEQAGSGRYRLRHTLDLSRDVADLTCHDDPEAALEIARYRDDGSYRAMRSSTDLRRGWVFPSLDEDGLWRALSRFYPAAIQDWYQGATQPRQATGFRSWASRQTAMYADVRKLGRDDVEQVITTCCAACHRRRSWTNDAVPEAPVSAETPPGGPLEEGTLATSDGLPEPIDIPCLEPCTLFATRARELLSNAHRDGPRH